jgi:trigger factor
LKVKISEPTKTTRELEFSVPQDLVQEEFNKRINKYSKEISIQGFRKGKVPKKIVVARFGPAIRSEAVEKVIDDALKSELKNAEIEPVALGEMKDFKDDETSDITFKVVVEVDAPIVITDYENLGITVAEESIDDAQVESELQELRKRFSTETEVDRISAVGDLIQGEYLSISMEGQAEPLPQDPKFQTEIGTSRTLGFDDGLIGLKKGDEKEITFTYDKNHSQEEFRGKSAKFKIKVLAVKEMELPELNEEFTQKLGAANLDELRDRIKESIQTQIKQKNVSEAHDKAVDILIEKNPFEVPEARIMHYIRHTVNQYKREKEEIEPTPEQIENLRPMALRDLRRYRILEFISNDKKIKVQQKDVDLRIMQMAAQYGMGFEQLKNSLRQSGRIVDIREELKIGKTLDYLVGLQDPQEN